MLGGIEVTAVRQRYVGGRSGVDVGTEIDRVRSVSWLRGGKRARGSVTGIEGHIVRHARNGKNGNGIYCRRGDRIEIFNRYERFLRRRLIVESMFLVSCYRLAVFRSIPESISSSDASWKAKKEARVTFPVPRQNGRTYNLCRGGNYPEKLNPDTC